MTPLLESWNDFLKERGCTVSSTSEGNIGFTLDDWNYFFHTEEDRPERYYVGLPGIAQIEDADQHAAAVTCSVFTTTDNHGIKVFLVKKENGLWVNAVVDYIFPDQEHGRHFFDRSLTILREAAFHFRRLYEATLEHMRSQAKPTPEM